MPDVNVRRIVLPKRIVVGLLNGDAMVNHNPGGEQDMAAVRLLKSAARHSESHSRAWVLEGDEKLLLHIAEYLESVDPIMGPRERFGFTTVDAQEAADLIRNQLTG